MTHPPTRLNRPRLVVLLGVGLLLALACTCGPVTRVMEIQATVGAARETVSAVQATVAPVLTDINQSLPTLQAQATEFILTMTAVAPQYYGTATSVVATADTLSGGAIGGRQLRQWAARASASSQFGDPSWSALQATGAPNTNGCGDFSTAWASATPSGLDWLRLEYDTPVVPLQIIIYETFNPGSISQVDVVDAQGVTITIFQNREVPPTCPWVKVINISNVPVRVATVIITVDQTQMQAWNEIDAVELVGVP